MSDTSAEAAALRLCLACGRENAPARCSRCLDAWFCGSDCQRAGWKAHKPNCRKPEAKGSGEAAQTAAPQGPGKSGQREAAEWEPLPQLPQVTRPSSERFAKLNWAHGKEADKLMVGAASQGDLMPKIMQLCQSKRHLDALGEALQWQLTDTSGGAKNIASSLWERLRFEPMPHEKHDYSLLHALPPAHPPKPPEAQKMIPFTVKDGQAGDGKYPEIGRRHVASLLGARCPVVDAEGSLSPETMSKLKPYMDVRNPMPCIIRNLPLFPRCIERWDVDYLAKHMGDQLYHTFAANQDVRRFAYFFDTRNEGGYESPPIAQACQMTFHDFIAKQRHKKDGKAYYLQTPVLQYGDDGIKCAKFDESMEDDLHQIDNAMMRQLQQLGSFGPISRNQLFVSFSDFMTAVHYDQQHNLFMQVRGAKRFLLFDAACFAALYPYPAHHPLDRKAMLDLEDPDLNSFPRSRALAGKGVEALLEEGDILYLPMSWFHHVHSLGPENVSLNFWFYDSNVLFMPSKVIWPLTWPSLIEFSRHIEYFIAEQLGPANVGAFVRWWLGDEAAPEATMLANRWRLIRNYILRQLTLQPKPVGASVLAMLDPRRWMGLKHRASDQIKAIEGLRNEHRLAELTDGLNELNMGILGPGMPGHVYRVIGQAVDVLPREKLRFYLEGAEEIVCLLRDNTDWNNGDGNTPVPGKGGFLFGREESRRMPNALIRSLQELNELALARKVKVATVDNGFFANWLQVLDARFFAPPTAQVEPDWVLTGLEREFNYGAKGDDVFRAVFEEPSSSDLQDPAADARDDAAAQEPFVVYHRYNLMLVNVFRGHFLRGPQAARRRRMYAAAAREIFRPRAEALRARDETLASVPRPSGTQLIGVHKRVDNPGTARMQFEQVMPSMDAYVEAVRRLAQRRGGGDFVVVLATDDERAEPSFQKAFNGKVICRSAVRRCAGGINEQSKMPIEVHGQKERLTVADALDCYVDALLLAACDAFIHADSNVTIAAGIMNPDSEAVHVRDLVPEAGSGGDWQGYRRCKLPC